MTRDEAEAKFIQELPRLERVVAALCGRHGVRGDDADDFTSTVKLRLVEDDYALLRKFRGESALSTFLTVVVRMLYRDWNVQRHGRWRPSAEARRLGTVAMRLEQLVHRDGMTLAQAAERLRTEGVTDLSDGALAAILRALPARMPLRPQAADGDAIDALPGAASADDIVAREEAERRRRSMDGALEVAVRELGVEDRLILRMRFRDGLSVADIARALQLPQKPLYRRLERLLVHLCKRLGELGVSSADVRELLDDDGTENGTTRPSN
jgi:RNA polymerase sigma factor (sigma-70 family)